MSNNRHLYHLVDVSPWPLVASCMALSLILGGWGYMHKIATSGSLFVYGLIGVLLVMFLWWRDIIRESTFQGHHTEVVQQGLRYGVILFIVSEVMFFFAFFWAYFHSSLAPTVEVGSFWPPQGISVFSAWGIPLVNTVILLVSGGTLTIAHHAIIAGKREDVKNAVEMTLFLALSFTMFQVIEYFEAPFSIADGIYGSCFFMATGFHGFHVLIGTIFIYVCSLRNVYFQYTRNHHFGFEAAAWYWHFVDVVWLFLFVTVYWWGGLE